MNTRKALGIIIFVSFAAVTASVLCLASAQPGAMENCGDMQGTPTVCPFMSVSIPAVPNAYGSFMRQFATILAFGALAAAFFVRNGKDRLDKLLLYIKAGRSTELYGRQANPILSLLSRGILHPRVFAL